MFEPEFDGLSSLDPVSMLSTPSSSDLGLTLVSLLDQQGLYPQTGGMPQQPP